MTNVVQLLLDIKKLRHFLIDSVNKLSSEAPENSERIRSGQEAVSLLEDSYKCINELTIQLVKQQREIERIKWLLQCEEANKEAVKKQNRDYIHRMKTAGINYSPYHDGR